MTPSAMFCYYEVIFPKRSRSAKGEIAFDDDDDARVVYIVWYIQHWVVEF